jgi:Holliday junction DNA helicase RuvA
MFKPITFKKGPGVFDFLSGSITTVKEKTITLSIGGMGFTIYVPKTSDFTPNSTTTLYTYFHWNQENGPSLYGFASELDRTVFLLIIDCPKIGPGIGMNILSQLSASQFLEIVSTSNQEALSDINGIGTKKAEQIIVELKHKVQKMLNNGQLKVDQQQQSFVQWQHLSEVLSSLNYTKQEIAKVTQHLAEKNSGQNYPLDQLIRAALAYLSQKQA